MPQQINKTKAIGELGRVAQLLHVFERNRPAIDCPDHGLGPPSHPRRWVQKDDKGYYGNDRDDDQQGPLPFTEGIEHKVVICNQ